MNQKDGENCWDYSKVVCEKDYCCQTETWVARSGSRSHYFVEIKSQDWQKDEGCNLWQVLNSALTLSTGTDAGISVWVTPRGHFYSAITIIRKRKILNYLILEGKTLGVGEAVSWCQNDNWATCCHFRQRISKNVFYFYLGNVAFLSVSPLCRLKSGSSQDLHRNPFRLSPPHPTHAT